MNHEGALCIFDVKTGESREILDNTTFVSIQNITFKTLKLCVTLIISLVTLQVLKCVLSISISTQRNFVPNALSQQVSF